MGTLAKKWLTYNLQNSIGAMYFVLKSVGSVGVKLPKSRFSRWMFTQNYLKLQKVFFCVSHVNIFCVNGCS